MHGQLGDDQKREMTCYSSPETEVDDGRDAISISKILTTHLIYSS